MGKNVNYTCDKCSRIIHRCDYYSDGFYLEINGKLFGECEPEQNRFKNILEKIRNRYYCKNCQNMVLDSLIELLGKKDGK